jgi:BirA family transcriptional regulator, biotin operon repressor / biotin---[acetyl-CoA-carboxylase] ligase
MKSPLLRGMVELEEVDSTQALAAELLARGEAPGVVLARHQTAGKGRFDRAWYSSAGESLTMSLVFLDYPEHPKPWLLGMSLAVAAAGVLHSRLRWPNDLVIQGKKVGGVLTELKPDMKGAMVPVVGLGINLNQTEFPLEVREVATSLALEREGNWQPREVALEILARLESLPEPSSWHDLQPIWRLFDDTPGKRYRLQSGEEAVALGIGPEGELLCAVEGESRTVMAADAILGQ